jgi:glycosyltransferase involved in cell wall biosynthesis
MKVIEIHNHYIQPGGEDEVFEAEMDLLNRMGHEVMTFVRDNYEINKMNPISVAVSSIWSKESNNKLKRLLKKLQPDVAHFHNTFLLISPSSYYACYEKGIPVIQSLHNPRLLCPAATFYRNGSVCEECMRSALSWPGVYHACYHNSRFQTSIVAVMTTIHRWLNTWREMVDIYVVFTDFYRRKFIEGGIPADKIVIKPHFIHPDPGSRENKFGNYAVFIGRLEPAKGVGTLLKAWRKLKEIPLKIRGDGLLLDYVRDFTKKYNLEFIELIARLDKEELYSLLKDACFLVWPSEGYYETFGLVAIEAFACGVPVIASSIGSMAEIIEDGRTGLHFIAGNPDDLANKVEWAWTHPKEMSEMGREARSEYELKYTAEKNYKMLIEIYETAIKRARMKK